MARLIALEWDAKELRLAVGRTRGTSLVVEQALSVPLPPREAGKESAGETEVGSALASAVANLGLGRCEAFVAVGRANIELRFLSTPPVPAEELPDVVRFQALRQFTTLGEEWPLDFVPLSPTSDGGMNVLAAAISPELVEQIRKACAAANLTVGRLVLRPFAAASLLQQELADSRCRMIIDLLRDDADLTVLIGPQVIFPRTVRLPTLTEPEPLAKAILGEVRRTIIAAQNQLGGRRVEEVIMFGDGAHHSVLKQLLEKELSLSVRLVDPLERVEWSDTQAPRPELPGTFAPLMGLLTDEAAGRAPAIDFLHPRRRPEPPNQQRRLAVAGAAVAALVLLGFGLLQWQLWTLDAQITRLTIERNNQDKLAKKSAEPVRNVAKLDEFASRDTVWLDELARLAQRLPPPEAVIVTELSTRQSKTGPQLLISGYADTANRVAELEDSLRDERHTVSGKGTTQDLRRQQLPWTFEETVTIGKPPAKAAARSAAKGPSPPPAKAAPAASATSVQGGMP